MKHSFKFYLLGGAFLLSLSMCLTSCEDVLGHWEKPTPPECTVTSISLDKTSLVLYIVGGEKTATLTPTLVGSPGLYKVFFSSSRPWVATVDEETGEVTAVDGGETTITAAIGDLYVDCEVKVYHKLHDISTGNAVIPDNQQWEIIGTSDAYKITIGDEATAVLNGVTINSTTGSCIETSGSTGSNIILVDGTTNTMDAHGDTNGSAAINTAFGPLNIFGQTKGTGKLVAKGGVSGAGIGGSLNFNSLAITILGGEIEATGGQNAAGIGSGDCTSSATGTSGGNITILGGKVTAKGGKNAAGIGTGYANSGNPAIKPACGSITIDKTVISVTATMGMSASEPIGRGGNAGSPNEPYCGEIFFGTAKMFDGSTWIISPDAGSHGDLKLAISTQNYTGDTWTLTPTN